MSLYVCFQTGHTRDVPQQVCAAGRESLPYIQHALRIAQ